MGDGIGMQLSRTKPRRKGVEYFGIYYRSNNTYSSPTADCYMGRGPEGEGHKSWIGHRLQAMAVGRRRVIGHGPQAAGHTP